MRNHKGLFSACLSAFPVVLQRIPPVALLLVLLLTAASMTGCVSSFKGEQAISIQKRGLLPQQEGVRD